MNSRKHIKSIDIKYINRRFTAVMLAFALAVCSFGCGLSIEQPEEEYEREIEPIPDVTVTVSLDAPPGHEKEQSNTDTGDSGEAQFPDAYENNESSEDYNIESTEEAYINNGLDGYTDEQIASAGAVNVGKFAYERLPADQKRIYNEIFLTLDNMSGEYEIDCHDVDLINNLFLCVMMDHPELFWVSGYVYTKYTRGDVLEAMGFKGAYTMDADTVTARKASIESYVSQCLAGMPASDDYAKIKYVYEYIIRNTDYDTSAVDNQNICSVFINGRSVCQGYAKAAQYLLNRAGVLCTLITGTAFGTGNHAWNLVRSNGSYYYLDVTWGDSNYRTEEGVEGTLPEISYDYLCVPGYEIFKTHTPDAPVDLPECISIDDNYYVREGAYFNSLDENKLKGLFDRAFSTGSDLVTIKASDASVYGIIRQYMLDEQNVFKYTGAYTGSNTISYWENKDLLTISFSLS